jgi:hypothetical protein
MKNSWIKRIEKLEAITRSSVDAAPVFRYGYVQHLPAGSAGEWHVAIATTESTALANVEHCVFEERLGAPSEVDDDLSFTVHLHVEDGLTRCASSEDKPIRQERPAKRTI